MNHLSAAHQAWKEHLCPGDAVVDATAGNGHDTCFLAQLLQGEGKLTAYDIQEHALTRTRQLLETTLTPQTLAIVELKHASHAVMTESNLALIVYNLGYLPGGDRAITTSVASTLVSLQYAQQALTSRGMLSIMCYPGHPEGALEEEAVVVWAAALPSSHWEVCHHRWLNRGLHAPSWLQIKRIF